MNTDFNRAGVYTEFQGLTELKAGARQQSPEALREAARQFEGIFVQMMLKNMRAASLGEGLMDNDQSKLYMEMFDNQVALDMTKGKGIGLADMLVKQLSGYGQGKPSEKANQLGEASPGLRRALQSYGVLPHEVSSHLNSASAHSFSPDTPQSFIHQVWPYAKKAADELGVDPRALVAQAALETGWGQAMIKRDDGSNSLNFFGIKAGDSWSGERASAMTHEYLDGQRINQRDDFRAYSSIEHAFSDYVELIKTSSRYSDVVEAAAHNDVDAYVQGLQQAGYATDPNYANKIKSIVDRGAFNETVISLQDVMGTPL